MSDSVARLNSALSGRYRVERQVGEGGMATVYLAADLKHDRKVALKVLKPELAAVVGAERFLAPRSAPPRTSSIRISCRCMTRAKLTASFLCDAVHRWRTRIPNRSPSGDHAPGSPD